MNPISFQPIQPAASMTSGGASRAANDARGADFGKIVGRFAKEVDQLQDQAAEQVASLAEGRHDNVHQVMLALGKAEVSFNYMLEVRNKLVEAYKEVMRMSV